MRMKRNTHTQYITKHKYKMKIKWEKTISEENRQTQPAINQIWKENYRLGFGWERTIRKKSEPLAVAAGDQTV